MKKIIRQYASACFVITLFILATFLSQNYTDFFLKILGQDKIFGGIAYVIVTIIATVIAPLTSIPLMPVVVATWGIFWAAVLSSTGWILGSIAVFWIARKFGVKIVKHFIDVEKIQAKYSNFPEKKLFWFLIFLRMVTPVDVLSYALGLFTNVSWRMYLITTIIGAIPMTFVLAYLGSLPVMFQIIFFGLGIVGVAMYLFLNRKKL
jgi:uncharacterized membrane protein YdjX (TVP38/TMEM64 family)